jgi:hypothetical protein
MGKNLLSGIGKSLEPRFIENSLTRAQHPGEMASSEPV